MNRLRDYLIYVSCQDLTTYHYKVLLLLIEEPLTQSIVANRLGISRQNINKVFRFLDQGSYIIIDRIEGNNKFYHLNLDVEKARQVMPGQIQF